MILRHVPLVVHTLGSAFNARLPLHVSHNAIRSVVHRPELEVDQCRELL